MIKWVLVFLCFAVGWFGTMGVIAALQLLNQHDKIEKLEKKIEKLEDDMNRTDKNISYLSKIIALDNEHITKSRKGIEK